MTLLIIFLGENFFFVIADVKKRFLSKDLSDSHLGQVAIIPRILTCLRVDSFLTLLLAVTPWGIINSK